MKAKFDKKVDKIYSVPISGVINRGEIQPGDILISVGTINPSFTKDFLREEFDKYSNGSYDRLLPLLSPVKLGQSIISHTFSGHNDSVHAGFCMGLDESNVPIITDLHGYVQDMSIYQYYTPTTLRVFRPNIDSFLFEMAKDTLFDSANIEDQARWVNRKFPDTNRFYFPGRLESKWNQDISHLLKIAITPSNFFSASNKTLNKTDKEMICSKLVIEAYKILLVQIAKNLNIKDESSFIQNYMNLLDNTTPKTLEGYLVDNVNYAQFIIPTEANIFDRVEHELIQINNEPLLNSYYTLSDNLLSTDFDQYTKTVIFLDELIKSRTKIPLELKKFLNSQGIIPRENVIPVCALKGPNKDNVNIDNGNGSHHELEGQYRQGKKVLNYIIHAENQDSCEKLQQVKENCKKQFERYETLQLLHENNKGIIDKNFGYEAKTLAFGAVVMGVAYMMLSKCSPSTFLSFCEQGGNFADIDTHSPSFTELTV